MNEQKETTTEQKEQQKKPTLQELLDEMAISQAELARQAHVSVYTVYNAISAKPLKRLSAQKLLKVINANLKRNYTMEDIEGLNLEEPRQKKE
jgi:predicted transcriptional regulator